jgi:hypothetical protein
MRHRRHEAIPLAVSGASVMEVISRATLEARRKYREPGSTGSLKATTNSGSRV